VTAEAAGAVLVTFNRRHYGMTRQILIPYRQK
jgi:allantoicase